MDDQLVELGPAPFAFDDIVSFGRVLRIESGMAVGKIHIRCDQPLATFARMVGHKPPEPRSQLHMGDLTYAWVAPGQWLVMGDQSAVTEITARFNDRGGDVVLALDITHARISMILSGTEARTALAAHCSLDLSHVAFPVDAVARSLLGEAALFIARQADLGGEPQFRVIVDQTMARYAVRLLAGAKSIGA